MALDDSSEDAVLHGMGEEEDDDDDDIFFFQTGKALRQPCVQCVVKRFDEYGRPILRTTMIQQEIRMDFSSSESEELDSAAKLLNGLKLSHNLENESGDIVSQSDYQLHFSDSQSDTPHLHLSNSEDNSEHDAVSDEIILQVEDWLERTEMLLIQPSQPVSIERSTEMTSSPSSQLHATLVNKSFPSPLDTPKMRSQARHRWLKERQKLVAQPHTARDIA